MEFGIISRIFASFVSIKYFGFALMIDTEQFTSDLIIPDFNAHILNKKHVFGIAQCARDCIHHMTCESAIYYRHELSCTLMTSSVGTGNSTVHAPERLQTNSSLVPTSVIPSDCALRSCPLRHVCVVLSSHRTVCMFSDCPMFTHPFLNGIFGPTLFNLVGSSIGFTCNPGYILNGSAIIHCNGHGDWIGQPPACDIVDCGELTTDMPDANFTAGDTVFNTTRYLFCPPEFIVVGSVNSTTCLANGNWSTLNATCKRDCGPPPAMNDAIFSPGITIEGATRSYTCNEGFYLVGNGNITCTAGNWTPNIGHCEKVSCGEPPTVQNATVNSGGITAFDARRYTCSPGLYMIGQRDITCLSSGQWDPLPGICRNCLPDYDPRGLQYNGYLNVTQTGVACMNWTDTGTGYQSMWSQSNYCRNPDGDNKPWCGTGISGNRLLYEFCDLHPC